MDTLRWLGHRISKGLRWLDHILLEPPPSMTGEERRTVRLLALSTFALIMLGVVVEVLSGGIVLAEYYKTHPYFQSPEFVVGVPMLVLTGIAYAFSRTRYYRLSMGLWITILMGGLWLCALISRDGPILSWALYEVMGLVIASMFVDALGTALLTGLIIAGQLLLLVLRPMTPADEILPGCIAIGLIGAFMILAQRHKALLEQDRHQQLTDANERLAQTNRALEHSIAEAQQARAIAEEANHLKTEFLAITSHELRTPLNSIIGFTVCMLNGIGVTGPELSEDQTSLLRRVESNSKHLLGKINDLLDVSQIEVQRIDVSLEPLSLGTLLDKAVAEIDHQAVVKGISLDAVVEPEMPDTILGDPQLLYRVVQHLLANAVKFTHQGKVKVMVKQADPAHWQLAVSDTGIGIAPERQEIIFEPFRQVDGSYKRRYEGTGLGLTVVRGNVHLMSGEISVESAPGSGSVFTVTLPLMLP